MVTNYFSNNKSVALQYYDLKRKYICKMSLLLCGKLIWVQKVKPSNMSKEYEITIEYDGKIPKVYLYNQGIMKYDDENIPHCYERKFKSPKKEFVRICLYYPITKEWTKEMFISDTIIPWAIEWLKYYELWRITGKWLGGGIEHEKN